MYFLVMTVCGFMINCDVTTAVVGTQGLTYVPNRDISSVHDAPGPPVSTDQPHFLASS